MQMHLRSPVPTSLVGSAACCSVVEITKLFDLDRAARPAKIHHPHGWWGWVAIGRARSARVELTRAIEDDPGALCARRGDRRRRAGGTGLTDRPVSTGFMLCG